MIGELEKAISAAVSFQPFSRVLGRQAEDQNTSDAPAEESGFDALLKQVLKIEDGKNVSEEELFAGLIQERLQTMKGDEALKKFQEHFEKEKLARTRYDGLVAMEDAARAALKKLVAEEVISEEEGDKIHSESFNAAQLDDNLESLFDGRGGPNDPTMAVASLQSALTSAKKKIDAYASSTESPLERLLDSTYDPYAGLSPDVRAAMLGGSHSSRSVSSGPSRPVDGANGFLFKPISDSDGKLVILLPEILTGDVNRVVLKNRRGREIEEGAYRGIGNGEREHFRFRQRGEDYPRNLTVEVELKNGNTKTYRIKDPSQRYD